MRKVLMGVALGALGMATSLEAATPVGDGVMLVVGNDVWQPGEQYRSESDWLALTCIAETCSFEPAKLAVRRESWQGHYDETPTAGQKLNFSRATRSNGKVIAWFRVDAKHPWLAPGSVTTHASRVARLKQPPSEGTFEVAVSLPDGGHVTFVPLFDLSAGTFHLQLRAQGQRQLLGELGDCSHVITTDYFLWAGDLDRDAKPDYLISFVDADGQVILYLSSMATSEEPVGIGGVYDAPPFGGECDG